MNNYKLGSLFDGYGGFPLAGVLCGIEPMWAAEVEPYPIAVTRSRFPNMKHLGDISKVNGAEIEPVDIITFGSPCQDLSVAGKRAGLKHEANGDEETTRSGLFMEAVRIIKEMRKATNGNYPRFAIWENVPGAFSSNNGEDFRIVCEELIKIVEPRASMPEVPKNGWNYADSYVGDGWSLAYRVFDAQYWGVPQRRRRIYLVADFRGECAREVLFEREGLRGYFTQGRTPWQGAPAHAEGGLGADDRQGEACGGGHGDGGRQLDAVGLTNRGFCSEDKAETLRAESHGALPMVAYGVTDPHILDDQGSSVINVREDGKSPTLRAQMGGHPPVVMVPNAVGVDLYNVAETGDKAATLTTQGGGTASGPSVVCAFPTHDQAPRFSGKRGDKTDGKGNGLGVGEPGDPMNTLTGGDRHAVAYGLDRASFNQGQNAKFDFSVSEEQQPTLTARGPGAVCTIGLNGAQVSPTLISRMSSAVGTTQDNLIVMEKHEGEGHPAMCRTTGSLTQATEEVSPTLMARDWKDPTVVCTNYIVRRLTPTECARLQGFADRWGWIEEKKALTEEEYKFWLEVRNTHARINGKTEQEYTAKQMLTWYNKLWTDSAEYKMWGNGIALPTALYCIQGMAEVLARPVIIEEDPDDWMN